MSIHRTVLRNFSIVVILSMLFSGFALPSVSAQGSDGIERQVNPQTGKVSFIGPEYGRTLSASKALGTYIRPQDPALALAKRFGSEFGLKNPERELSEIKTNRSENGRLTVHYQQNYEGIPVMGGELIVNTNGNGDLYSINGEISPELSLSIQPTIDSDQAQQTALQAAAKWYEKTPEDFVVSTPKLWIYDESLLHPSTRPAELVWRMEITPKDAAMPVRELVLVNAQRGNISLLFNQVDMDWSRSEKPDLVQDAQPTPTPPPTETTLPIETSEPTLVVTPTPIPTEASNPTDKLSSQEKPINEVTTSAGATWYVAPAGNDSNSCSVPASPCLTMNGAIAKAGTGEFIQVASGTYTNPSGNVVTISKGLTLSGGWDSTFTTQNGVSIIDGGGAQNGILANSSGSNVVVEHFVIQNSFTGMDSGGIYIYGANFTLKNSSVINNNAGAKGAGIFMIANGTLTVLNSTISGNRAGSSGGGIYATNGTVTINNSTIAFNNSNATGGGVGRESATISIKNSILAKNSAVGSGPDCFDAISASDHNILGNTTGCTVTAGTGDHFNVDPSIDTFSGSMPVHPLLANSPAINAGDNNTCLTIDQRGMPRPYGSACDIGAYEYSTTGNLVGVSGSNQTAKPGSPFALPLTVHLFDSFANPVSGATITFTAPASGASGTFANSGTNVTTAITDSNGNATSAIFTANNQVGSYSITAAANDYGYSTAFSLKNAIVDYFVSPTGLDSNSCDLPSSPCLTINAAIGKAAAGKTIAVASGTYTGSGNQVVLVNKNVTLLGGWNSTFSTQNSTSTIDGQGARRGIVVNSGITALIDRFTIQNGFDTGFGGGIYNYGILTLNNSVVKNNLSEWMGGGIYNYGTLTVNDTTISGNKAGKTGYSGGGGGAGISNAGGTVTVNHSEIKENAIVGSFSASAIDLNTNAIVILNATTVRNNTGAEGIHLFGGQLTLNNSIIDGHPQGGIRNGPGQISLNNSLISNNFFGISSGGYPNTTATLQNSIVAQNTSFDCSGTITSNGHNLIGNTSSCTFTPVAGDLTNVDPKLGAVMIGTPPYRVLLSGSPAIDAGDAATCLATDQRGVTRPQGSVCDIGAYEYMVPGSAASMGIVSGSDQRAGPLLPFSKPLSAYVVDSSGSPVSGANVTFTAPASGASGTFATTGTNMTTVPTNADGIATASVFTANSQLGAYAVTATVSGVSGTATFALTNASWYVSPAGNDANSCSVPASPCLTIGGAVSKAYNADAIQVAVGIYTGSSTAVVNTAKDLILSGGWNSTFTSQTGLSVIDGQGVRTGVYTTAAKTAIDHFIVQNGYTTSSGGGIYNRTGSLSVSNSLIVNNQAEGHGGGILSEGDLTINNSTIRKNSALSSGGIDLYYLNDYLTLNNSTVADNQARNYGGGIGMTYSYSYGSETPGTITIQNSTIVNNSALGGGGINNSTSARPLYLKNSILANNTGSSNGPNCYGPINSLDHSLLGNVSNCSFSAGADSLLNANPLLSSYPLGILGYYALQPASPAINAGANCLSADQRGVARPQGSACDMGAYEYVAAGAAAAFGVVDGSNQRSGTLRPFPKPLVIYVVDGAGSPVSGVNVTFTAPASGASGTFAGSGTNIGTVSTNADGAAISSIFTANSQLGTYNVVAAVTGLSGSVTFTLTNADLFVSPSGSDTNSCTSPAAPCVTINGAINKVQNGDVIKVSVGTYVTTGSTQITKDLSLSGGWDTAFSNQTGFSVIDGNNGSSYGIWSSGSNVSISRFIVRNYQVGLYHSGGTLAFDRSALIDNKTAMYNYAGDATLTNVTISGSSGSGYAGSAISNVQGLVSIQYSTITNNSGYYAIYSANGGASIKLGSSILAGNSSTDCYIGSNPAFSEGYNIFGRSPACSGSYTLQPTDKVGTDPKLFSLLSGSYHPVLSGSPAIDAANSATCPSTDQRGVNRPIGSGCDIGAVEYGGSGTTPAYIIAYEGNGQSIPPGSSSTTKLKVVVLDQNGDSVSGQTVTFTAPASGASIIFADTHTYSSTAITDVNGIATSAAFSANNVTGGYTVSATVAGVANPANFQLFNGSQKVKTYTANNSTSLPGTLLCDQSQSNCTNGNNPHADAAHKYAIGTYNFYMSQHQRDSIDNHNMLITSTVHYYSGYANAFWNGFQMVYGDAYGFPLADDVVAHELTHGVTQYESNLFYYYQSGAINESFSDLWGEFYDQTNGLGNDTDGVKWQMGEDVAGIGAIRNMSDPTLFGDPDKISSPNYYEGEGDNGGVHYNSGVNNKAVFLMVDGGTFNGKTVSPLGWDKTAAIYYEVNTNLLSSGADYSDLYYALQQACTNLIGQKGITAGDCGEVKDAVDAVEMNGQPVPNFNTDAPYCDAGNPVTTLLSDDLEAGTGNWTFTNGAYPRWQFDSPYGSYAHSGNHFLYADDYPGVITDASARLKSFVVPNNAYLRFAQAYDFETGYNPSDFLDGGVLEYSLNNGSTWLDAGSLIDFNGYKGTIYTGNNNPLQGRSAFVGTSHGYISTRLNLASLAGETVSFRWRMGLDKSGYVWGWWMDDVKAYQCPQPETTPPTVTSIIRVGSKITKSTSIAFTVTFSESVNGVSESDFSLHATGNISGAAISSVTGSGATYTVTVNTGTKNGTLRLDVPASATITDLAGNALVGLPFEAGEVYTIIKTGADTTGVFRLTNGVIFLKNKNETGFADMGLNYGVPGDYPVVGDWDGDGTVTIGVYRNGQFLLRNENTVGFAEMVFPFGQPGDQPIAGDWNGDGIDTIGVYRPSNGQFLLRNSNSAGVADASFYLGNVGDVGIAGDWNGDGIDTTGVFRPSNGVIFLKDKNETGYADLALNYGIPGDKPVTGDWDNDGVDTIGVYRNGQFLLRNSNTIGFAEIVFGLGNPSDMPIAGDWDALP